ncbi:MAG: ATP-binding protein, partial [Ktedonobacteraceae bacterium]|nr:ATP-binding protein [Ktedonobacteraceae bacterium]
MVPGFDLKSLNVLGKLIAELERFNLEGAVPEEFRPADLFDEAEQVFFLVQGLANFWQKESSGDFKQHTVDMVISTHGQRLADLTLVLLGTPRKLSVYISLGTEQTTRTLLEGIFPGIELERVSREKMVSLVKPHCVVQGVLTGVPSRKDYRPERFDEPKKSQNPQPASATSTQQNQSLLERVIRGMYGGTWCYIVQAHPRPRAQVVQDRMKVVDLLTQITSRSRVQWNSTKQESSTHTSTESASQTHSYSGDMVNYRAQYLIKLLERELERLDQGAAVGQWIVRTYFGATQADDARRVASLLLGTMAGQDSRPDPLRTAICQPSGGMSLSNFHTFLTSNELATLIQPPREEVAGYAIHDHVYFDVDFRATGEGYLPLGSIMQSGRDTRNTFDISLDALTKHAVVIGVTGSGKTTTVMSMLDRVVDARKPFLVIEPAKTEYRALGSALAGRANLRIFTLGSETVAPFRLNPFEFQTDDEPGSVSLLTHIDFLKAVFNAAFVLYSPMPHVLEEALHEVYEDKGWDLASGQNRRVPDWKERHKYPIFPTLTDLFYKVEAVTNRLGYDREVESNVKAGLKSRIGSLRIGSKGLMLDTARGVPMANLLSTPTILELENIGSDDEKTFLMGLLLARLYEFRRMQAAHNAREGAALSTGLQHLIVFEEAHRLLKNTSTQVDSESSNMRAQAIEVFTNMLSEVRAYGQGVLVAEQIPSKLAPDVLKNTNLKVVHRLIAQDDRQSIGQTMNLNDDQQTHLGILNPGM